MKDKLSGQNPEANKQSMDSSTNGSDNYQPNETHQNKTAHDNSLHSNSKTNSTINEENVKGFRKTKSGIYVTENLAEEIENDLKNTKGFFGKGWLSKLKPSATAIAITGAEMGLSYYAEHTDNQTVKTVANVLDKADTISWAANGAAIGSFIPGIGTVVGGVIGAVAGFTKDVMDGDVGNAINYLFSPHQQSTMQTIQQNPQALGQAIYRDMTNNSIYNTKLLETPQHTSVKTAGGTLPITTNSGKLVIGTHPTDIPSQQFIQAMQNPEVRQQYYLILHPEI